MVFAVKASLIRDIFVQLYLQKSSRKVNEKVKT